MTVRQIIAVVDDEPGILRGIERLLSRHDFDTEVYGSGEAFLARSEIARLACAILDIHLGGMSGIEVRRQLAIRNAALPIIFMTAVDSTAVRNEAARAGHAAFLPKPFSAEELVNAVRQATARVHI